jgi:hypothetical protein
VRTEAAIVELLKDSREWRTFFKGSCETSAFRLRSQAYRYRDELAERGFVAELGAVQDTLFELARDLFPESPAADFSAWAELLYRDALARIQEHFTTLSANQKDAMDLSRAWECNDRMEAAVRDEDLPAYREAVRVYEREALGALEETKKTSGAA